MQDVGVMNSIFPITTKRGIIIRKIENSDIEFCKSYLRANFYREFNDYNVPSIITDTALEEIIIKWIDNYKNNVDGGESYRFVLEDNNKLIGGGTINNTNNNSVVELSYFIVPKHQGNGLATIMLYEIGKALSQLYCEIRVRIREDNVASIKLVTKAGYKKLGNIKGAVKQNYIYSKTL